MNESIELDCACENCPGEGCTCGCQTPAAVSACNCGPQCLCGPDCACSAAVND